MGMNLDELDQQQEDRRKRHTSWKWDPVQMKMVPQDATHQVFGAKDYIHGDPAERWTTCTSCNIDKWAVVGTKCSCGGTRILWKDRPEIQKDLVDPRTTVIGSTKRINTECNAVSGFWETCERGTVGCTNHRRKAATSCPIKHTASCTCSPPVIVDYKMLRNAESASLHCLGALKPDASQDRMSREDLDYFAIAISRMMAHWARRALGHKPEDEK